MSDLDPSAGAEKKIVALNGRVCCVLDLPCCPPPPAAGKIPTASPQALAVADLLKKAAYTLDDDALEDEVYAHMATALLQHVDLVPKGVGSAIVAGYSRWLSKTPVP